MRDRSSQGLSIPVTWSVGGTGETLAHSKAPVHIRTPNAAEIEAVESRVNVCGECVHFDLEEGQRLMRATRFLERLERENGWKLEYLGSPPQQLGLCRAWGGAEQKSGGETITGIFHKACDGFRVSNGLVRLRTRRGGAT